jgi:hypothetical protein
LKPGRPAGGAASLGFRCHSGWAVLVALRGPRDAPEVALRRRIELSRKTPRQPFHAAEGRAFRDAETLIGRSIAEARDLAARAVKEAVEELRGAGDEVVAGGLLLAAGRPLPALAEILASHALIHAAEGEMFRDAVREAARRCGLALAGVKERELAEKAARMLRRPAGELTAHVAGWGRSLGPPWRQDEKLAALVAWLALAEPRQD